MAIITPENLQEEAFKNHMENLAKPNEDLEYIMTILVDITHALGANYEQIKRCQTEGLTNHGNTVRDIRAGLDSLKSQLLVVRGTAESNRSLIGLFAQKITAAEMALDNLQKMIQPMDEEMVRTA